MLKKGSSLRPSWHRIRTAEGVKLRKSPGTKGINFFLSSVIPCGFVFTIEGFWKQAFTTTRSALLITPGNDEISVDSPFSFQCFNRGLIFWDILR